MPTLMCTSDGTPLNYRGNDIGEVYFIQAGSNGLIKIGFSRDVVARLDTIQCANPRARIIGAAPGTILDERRWHREMAEFRRDREWFSPHPYLLDRMMAAILNEGRLGAEIMAESRTIHRIKRRRAKRPAKSAA